MDMGKEEGEFSGDGGDSLPYQKRMWKQLQGKSKPSFLSHKLAPSRGGEGKKEGGIWLFKKKKQHQRNALVRTLSSSHPNLHSLGSLRVGEREDKKPLRCGAADPRIGQQTPKTAAAAVHGNSTAGAGMTKQTGSMQKTGSPNKPTVEHLVQTHHHKSSSLGSACIDTVLQKDLVPKYGEKQQLDYDEDMVSGHHWRARVTHSAEWLVAEGKTTLSYPGLLY